MEKQELLHTLQRCVEEIRSLRAQVNRLQPKAEAYDNLATIIDLIPRRPMPMGEDLAWRLEAQIQQLKAQPDCSEDPASE